MKIEEKYKQNFEEAWIIALVKLDMEGSFKVGDSNILA